MRWLRLRGLLVLALAPLLACAVSGPTESLRPEPFQMSSVEGDGDPARRASTRLVLEGLDADTGGRRAQALELLQRSLQVDPTNPWAYLALARHRLDGPHPEEALPPLDQADALLRAQGELAPGVETHLIGMRGAAMFARGDVEEGRRGLQEAAARSPETWSDGWLDADELR